MASAKSSRSRTSGVVSALDNPQEKVVPLSDRLKVFKSDSFDPNAFVQSKCQSVNEKEISQLCSYLNELKRASAEEMRKSVYANYSAFIRTSKEISDLEGELLSIRNLLSTEAGLIHALVEGVNIDSLSVAEGLTSDNLSNFEDGEPSDVEKWAAELPDLLDVLLAERRIDEALNALGEGDRAATEAEKNKMLTPSSISLLQTALSKHRMTLADQLAEIASQPSTRGVELRSAVSALKRLGDGRRAHSLLLNAHYQRLQCSMQSLRPSGTSYGGAYTAALSQLVFSVIAQAAVDSFTVFGEEPAYASELVMWSSKQTEAFALLVKRHALSSSAAAGGLRAAAECVQIALGHCSLLEAQGLTLSPVLMRLFKPSVEQALEANLRRIEESTAAFGAVDDWVLTTSPSSSRPRAFNVAVGSGTAFQPKVSASAHRFNAMVQDFFEDVAPLLTMQLGNSTLEGLFQVFDSYVNLLINALPGSIDDDGVGPGNKIVRIADTEEQQIALLANASLLADELLPRASMKLSPSYEASAIDDTRKRASESQSRLPEQREWKRRLQRSVDRLRDSFCRQHALDLIFTADGDTHLSAEMYINMEGHVDEHEWSPSPVFQELYLKLNKVASIAADVFVGRERVATILLMRLTETVILWLSKDQSFWEDIEDGPKPLGPLGLKQFLLDMEFVTRFSSQGRFMSRHLHQVIKDIIARAMNAFSSTGMDPYSELPYDEWFGEVSEEVMLQLSGKGKLMNGNREPNSPTVSVSAQSMASFRSHGST